MIAFTTRVRGVSSDLRIALQQQLTSARREVETSKALLEAEREFVRARGVAEQRRAQLAEASHDLRQPIAALRLYIDRLPQKIGDVGKPSLVRALEFVESILVQNLEKTDHSNEKNLTPPDYTDTGKTAIADNDAELETFPAQLILDTCHAMFFDQAKHKNLELRVLGSSLELRSAATPVLRVVCNLVSNAVKFTQQDKVVVGVVRRGERVEFIIADTGPGIEDSERERLFQPYEKTIDSVGHGLGLAIAKQLCDANDLDMRMTTKPGAGTCFRVSVPRSLSSTIDSQMG
jgi:signal transduction histidine kinase